MKKFSNILAATDFSGPAHHAIERAARISKDTGAALTLLHVSEPASIEVLKQLWSDQPTLSESEAVQAARQKLDELAASLFEQYQISARTRVVAGSFLSELAREADSIAADLIVCGDSGGNAVQHLLVGTTAERIIGNARSPVLIVKRTARESYRSVLVAVDLSTASQRSVIEARAIAPSAEYVLLHAFDAPFAEKLKNAEVGEKLLTHYRATARTQAAASVHTLSDNAGLPTERTRFSVLQGDPLRRILEHEQTHMLDLIVVARSGHRLLETLLVGSITRHVVGRSRCDVLVSI